MPTRAHHGPRFVLGLLHPLGPARLNIEPDGLVGSIHLEISLDWNVGKIVLRLTEGRADRFRDADNQERPAINQEFVANGIHAGEKLNGQVIANHGDLGAALIVTHPRRCSGRRAV